jgi:hypothetical protein
MCQYKHALNSVVDLSFLKWFICVIAYGKEVVAVSPHTLNADKVGSVYDHTPISE